MIRNCRICRSHNLREIINLGNMHYTGKFKHQDEVVPQALLKLLICDECGLTQLSNNFSLKYLYNDDYAYRSGVNEAMKLRLSELADTASSLVLLNKDDLVLDIASNDGTLLNSYKNKEIKRFGIDPTINKFINNYKEIDFYESDFFGYKNYTKHTKQKAKIITCVSMFYDLPDPNLFLRAIKKVLHQDGVFILEQSDLSLMIENNSFDTICHEHLEYYSIGVLKYLLESNGFTIFKHEYNDANGGSSRLYICHNANQNFSYDGDIAALIKKEDASGVNNGEAITKMMERIEVIKIKLVKLLTELKNNGKSIHGYGASTKGNVLLQHFGLSGYFDYISDRDPAKDGLMTPDKKFNIISEEKSRSMNPDYYLVLPWHFRPTIIARETKAMNNKIKFIFPLPELEIV